MATAITDKGVSTAADATFSIMAGNISNITSDFTIKTAKLTMKGRNLHWNTADPTWDVTEYNKKGAIYAICDARVTIDNEIGYSNTLVGLALTVSGNTLRTYLARPNNVYYPTVVLHVQPIAIWIEKS